uniref:Uncharacterized protein n=1 Tax=Romanomermis culicivorax TaxID=13658 RepID=A0A915JVT4_ROMCU
MREEGAQNELQITFSGYLDIIFDTLEGHKRYKDKNLTLITDWLMPKLDRSKIVIVKVFDEFGCVNSFRNGMGIVYGFFEKYSSVNVNDHNKFCVFTSRLPPISLPMPKGHPPAAIMHASPPEDPPTVLKFTQ